MTAPVTTLLVALTALRLFMAATTPMAPDEAYYWIWSRGLAPGYLDHPPMVALWIAAGTAIFGKTALGVRVLGPLSAGFASWLLFDAGRRLFPGTKAGQTAVLLLNASLFLGVGSVIMTPDTPLLFFWTATLWAASYIAAGRSGAWWLAIGLLGGFALASKYTALLLWLGLAIWVLLTPRLHQWLRRWQAYAGAAIGFLVFLPVLIWNADHHWAGFVKQGGRIGDWQPLRAAGFIAELIGSQVGLATPLIFGMCMAGLAEAVRRSLRERPDAWTLLASLSLPPILVFLQHAIGDRVQGNWPAIIYPGLCLAAGGSVASRRWINAGAGLGFALSILVYLQVLFRLVPLPPAMDPIALRLAGWDSLAQRVGTIAVSSHARFVAADGYALASELAWWMPVSLPVLGTDERWHLTVLPPAREEGQTGLLIRDARRDDPPDSEVWSQAVPLETVSRPDTPRSGVVVFRVLAALGSAQARLLPR